MEVKLKDLALFLKARLEGDPELTIHSPGKIEEAKPGQIVFFANPKYENHLYSTQATAVILEKDYVLKQPISAALLRVDNVYASIGLLLEKYNHQVQTKTPGISNMAVIHPSVATDPTMFIDSFVNIEEGVLLGQDLVLHSHVSIGKNSQIGRGCVLHPGVKIYPHTRIGDHTIIHANTVVGSDGFGFSPEEDGTYKKIPHIGRVDIGNHVEIGANCTIDRASMGATIIEDGVKLDNLIQVGHNVRIGKNTVIAAQTGVAGSTTIGESCRIGGQVGFVGHIQIGNRVQIQAQSGVSKSWKDGEKLFGTPAIPYLDYVKSYAIFKVLPQLNKIISKLNKE
jgi:UDP-3-O-[3-hydroxymyristoyl] glucosamine N-acyltransferase